ncbi:hypothetical protein [Phytomonospora endophytica]|uniref:Uncharacterized protein n=1 Tax=Phytomonospora endophytica TaxID=714109 RepID=A0A841FTS7_9ACTN|nr:hypothetical protein [Phytomonospora endophytica]MBB6035380.1 hypothetical protein [Phytomonospora endophytica]GIG63868.1 hypothetical protein Pen01_01630 [Phytomonospora endophytica]
MNPLARLFKGPGAMPEHLRARLVGEDLVFLAEGLSGSITYRRLRAPGQYSNWMREPATGAIGISSQGLVVWANKVKQIDVPHRHPLRQRIAVRLDGERKVVFGFELGWTNTAVSGAAEVRLKLEPGGARRVVGILTAG